MLLFFLFFSFVFSVCVVAVSTASAFTISRQLYVVLPMSFLFFFFFFASAAQPPTSGDTEANLSHEEQLRRERQRQMSVGITNYQWTGVDCPGPKQIMVVSQGNIFVGVCETTDSSPANQTIFRKLFDKSSTGLNGGAIDPHFSPDGSKVAFVQDSELFVLPVDGDGVAPVQLTFGARAAGKTNGLADFIAQEEMDRSVKVNMLVSAVLG